MSMPVLAGDVLSGKVIGISDGDTITVLAAGRGLWADKGPVPPWEWRKAGRHK